VVHIAKSNVNFSAVSCLFLDCWSISLGAAVYIHMCHSFSLSHSAAVRCAAAVDIFCYVWADSAGPGAIALAQTSASLCSGPENVFELLCGAYSRGSTTTINSLNASANRASEWGSAIRLTQAFALVVQFSSFVASGTANCLIFS
jgi:hypothetical protein